MTTPTPLPPLPTPQLPPEPTAMGRYALYVEPGGGMLLLVNSVTGRDPDGMPIYSDTRRVEIDATQLAMARAATAMFPMPFDPIEGLVKLLRGE